MVRGQGFSPICLKYTIFARSRSLSLSAESEGRGGKHAC